jgi:hypothetical protein
MSIVQQRHLAMPSYVVAASFVFIPIFDEVMRLLPTANIHDPRWRFGGIGLLSNMLVLPIAGLMIAFVIAAVFEHGVVQRVLATFSLLAAVVIVVLLLLFVLDALQVRSMMKPEAFASWTVATVTAVGKFLVATVALAGFAVAGFRAPPTPKPLSALGPSALVVGPPPPQAVDGVNGPGAQIGLGSAERR